MEENKQKILQILNSFNIGIETITEYQGNSLTLYQIKPKIGVKISRIRNLKDELAVGLSVPAVRIIAPMENGMVGIEIPNKKRENIPISEILNSWIFQNTGMTLPCALGRTVTGEVFIADLAEMPHLLVAGATGQGKSVGLNVMLLSLLNKLSPDKLKLVLIDPKRVEFNIYSKLENSYLATPVITSPEEAGQKLQAICTLMDERYALLSSARVRNIGEYNTISVDEPMPFVVVVIDEFGDLILTCGKELERIICRIAQKARAVGIHLIISTQRPSSNIVTGNIKANFPTRIAFRTTTNMDSRLILDQAGAEKLTGKGDMLFFNGSEITRVQCAYASVSDVNATCNAIIEKHAECQNTFRLPLSPTELAQKQIEEYLRKEEEEKQMWLKREKDAEQRMQDWRKEREQNEEAREARRKQLFRHFYGCNTNYMTLCIPGNSILKNNTEKEDE